MSTIVYQQASQPSIDSSHHVLEATTMRLKLVSPKSCNQKTLFGGWTFLQSQKPMEDFDTNTSYLDHNNQYSLKLSQKSLELCTESLGSESGSDASENNDAIFAFPAASVKRGRREQAGESKKVSSRSFPPPLTTMSGPKPFQVRPHREGGRLIIEAMETSLGSSTCCLRAERSHGRLRLTCWKSEEGDCDTKNGEENDVNDVGKKMEEEMERNVVVENFQRVRRCNEEEHGDKGICCHWESASCWVATS